LLCPFDGGGGIAGDAFATEPNLELVPSDPRSFTAVPDPLSLLPLPATLAAPPPLPDPLAAPPPLPDPGRIGPLRLLLAFLAAPPAPPRFVWPEAATLMAVLMLAASTAE
jgi:hypothetical protein